MNETWVAPQLVASLRSAAASLCATDAIEAAVRALTPKLGTEVTLDVERRAALVSLFVRNLRGLPVAQASQLEHDLLTAVNALPVSLKTLEVRDALSLVAIRNHIRYFCVSINLDWATGMQVQSSLSELSHLLQEAGGGTFQLQVDHRDHAINIKVKWRKPLTLEASLSSWLSSLPRCIQARMGEIDQCEITITVTRNSGKGTQ